MRITRLAPLCVLCLGSSLAAANPNPLAIPEHAGTYVCVDDSGSRSSYKLDYDNATMTVTTTLGRIAMSGVYFVTRNEPQKSVAYTLAGTGATLHFSARGVSASSSLRCDKQP